MVAPLMFVGERRAALAACAPRVAAVSLPLSPFACLSLLPRSALLVLEPSLCCLDLPSARLPVPTILPSVHGTLRAATPPPTGISPLASAAKVPLALAHYLGMSGAPDPSLCTVMEEEEVMGEEGRRKRRRADVHEGEFLIPLRLT